LYEFSMRVTMKRPSAPAPAGSAPGAVVAGKTA
jgi:hypothetical protein